jgi:hypothetical protein
MAKATSSKERSKLHLVPLTHEPLLHLANIPQTLKMNVSACEETLSRSNARHMGRHIEIWVAPKNARNQPMSESARAEIGWARQWESLGDSQTTKSDRERRLLPHIGLQEGGAEDTRNPSAKAKIETMKCLQDVRGGASAKEVNHLAEPKATAEESELNLGVIHLLKDRMDLNNLLYPPLKEIYHKLPRANG